MLVCTHPKKQLKESKKKKKKLVLNFINEHQKTKMLNFFLFLFHQLFLLSTKSCCWTNYTQQRQQNYIKTYLLPIDSFKWGHFFLFWLRKWGSTSVFVSWMRLSAYCTFIFSKYQTRSIFFWGVKQPKTVHWKMPNI